MFKPIPYDTFGGMATRWAPEKLPPRYCMLARNVKFIGDSVRSRDGLTTAFSTNNSKAVTGLVQFTTLDGTHVPIAFDAAGTLVIESPSGSGGVTAIDVGVGNDLYMEGDNTLYHQFMAFSDLKVASSTVEASPKIYYKADDGNFYINLIGLVPNAVPVAAGNSTGVGDVNSGVRYVVTLFKTLSGYIGGMTDAAPLAVTITDDNRKVTISGIPLGPGNTVARILAFTEAGASSAGPYYYIPLDDVLQELNADITKTIVEDNTTTTAEFNFTDDYLVGTSDVTQFFDKIQIPHQVSCFFSKTLRRMIWAGEDRNIFRVSAPDDPETYFGTTGYVYAGQGDGQRAICAREFRSEVYLLKEASGYSVAESSSEPSTWKVPQRWEKKGVWGPRAVDVCGSFMAMADDTGLHIWDGASMTWLSMEISGDKDNGELSWDRINKDYGHLVWVCIDDVNKDIHVGVPLDVATTISHEFVLDYSGGLARYARKWSYNTTHFTLLRKMYRPITGDVDNRLKASQLCGGSADPDGQVVMIDPSAHGDCGNAIDSQFVTRFEPSARMGTVYQLGALDVSVMGIGQLQLARLTLRDQLVALRDLSLDGEKFIDHTLKPTGQHERFAFKLSMNTAGSWFAAQRVTAYVNPLWQQRVI